jgi:hypothetical protein
MTFIQRLGIATAIAATFPLFVVNYSLPAAYETHLLFTCTFVWLLMMPLSLYSSPTAPVCHDAHVNPAPAFLKDASLRALVGRYIVLVSMAIFMAFLLFASYAFAEKYELVVLGPVIALGPIGAYLYLTPMCPYCRKLNRPNLRECVNCGNTVLPHLLQKSIPYP